MIYFRSDYSQGAHPKVMEALARTNLEHTDGYGVDAHCKRAAELVRELTKDPDASVYMMTGGTSCNVTVASCLRPYQSVISARSGHMYYHETGAVEATGHRVLALESVDGKLSPELIDKAMSEFEDEHTPQPKMVYLSQSTEIGTVYSRSELAAIRDKCNEYGLFLYLDGARLGAALTSRGNDLSIDELAALCDAYGEDTGDGRTKTFPTARALADAGEDAIFALRTGFRAKYITDAARKVANGEIDLAAVAREEDFTACEAELMKIKGVGPKVADCALLFGFGKTEAYPVDVWMKKVAARHFESGPDPRLFGKYAGIAQQYLFYMERYGV